MGAPVADDVHAKIAAAVLPAPTAPETVEAEASEPEPEADAPERPKRTRRSSAQVKADEEAALAAKAQHEVRQDREKLEVPAEVVQEPANPPTVTVPTPEPVTAETAPSAPASDASPSDGEIDLPTLMAAAQQFTTFLPNDKTGAILTEFGVPHDKNDLLPIPRKLITPILRHLDSTKLSEIPAEKRAWTRDLINRLVTAE